MGKFVEFFGPGVAQLSIADRATISNMCPEYGATVGYFAVDEMNLKYLKQTGTCIYCVAGQFWRLGLHYCNWADLYQKLVCSYLYRVLFLFLGVVISCIFRVPVL